MLRFDSKALHAALDHQRHKRGLTWKQVAEATGVSAATLTRTRIGGRLEVDGVLAMVRWLGKPVEEFTRDDGVRPTGRDGPP
jgi:transcriptional regulator with XRE-family HTH domain